jgi:hypothetical protein
MVEAANSTCFLTGIWAKMLVRWKLRQAARPTLDHAQGADVPALQGDTAAGEAAPARDGVDDGGLAGTVGADEAADLAALQRQVDAVQGLDAAVVDGHVGGLQHVIRHGG